MMTGSCEPNLSGLRVLVVEDTLLVADLIVDALREHGCTVVGPVPRLEQGLTLAVDEQLDGALLDVNLAGKRCFPIAETLTARGVPFAFLTGYGDAGIPSKYRGSARLAKPFSVDILLQTVNGLFKVNT
jgi:DNA-binding response OmpR family regulator